VFGHERVLLFSSEKIDDMSTCPSWLSPDSDVFTPEIWPCTAERRSGVLTVGGIAVTDLVAEFGSPLYLLDEADFRARAAAFRDAFAPWRVYYAGKAFLCSAVARWAHECGLGVDVCSPGELALALRGGVPAALIGLHGNNKTVDELRTAIQVGVGRIVVDAEDEIDRLEALVASRPAGAAAVPVMVRVTPDVEAHAHAWVQTGVLDQKFGFALHGGVAAAALRRLEAIPGLDLLGIHCHIGSQILGTDAHELAISRMVGLLAEFRDATGRELAALDLGGGFGIAYTVADRPPAPADVAARLREVVDRCCREAGLAVPEISIEPGRAIVGQAGVAVYTVGVVKPVDFDGGRRVYVSVDGGMSDNPRPALYQSEYSALLANRASTADPVLARVVGVHCETGDILVPHTYLPGDVRIGDLIAVPAAGAYQRSMASNYNETPRPPVVAVRDGAAAVLVRRETIDDLLGLDVGR